MREYNTTIPIVWNLGFGHTDPQIVVPRGRTARMDMGQEKIVLPY